VTEPIFAAVEHDLQRGWDAFRDHLPHRHYHDPGTAATPATEAPMSVISTFEADAEEALAKVQELVREKLPTALADTKKLAGNPVVDALLSAVHVPAEALSMAVTVINQLEELYKPETAAQSPADPAMGDQPAAAEPQPAPVA
jgi:hypothetical protein